MKHVIKGIAIVALLATLWIGKSTAASSATLLCHRVMGQCEDNGCYASMGGVCDDSCDCVF